ncbi:MAG: hypothetical protein D6782_08160 [Alphaproteobacteria bacterium]|nr:MAG: hypothetical protein D6782_08160 [Alphaproteobacteria bacterium]
MSVMRFAALIWALIFGIWLPGGPAHGAVAPETRAKVMALLSRIESKDYGIRPGFIEALRAKAQNADGIEKLRALYQLQFFSLYDQAEEQQAIKRLEEEARRQNNRSYLALARSYAIYNDFLAGTSPDGFQAMQKELAAAQAADDWLAETQVREVLAYAGLSQMRQEFALQSLKGALAIIPADAPEADFVRLALLTALGFVQADYGDLDSLIESSTQILDLADASGLPALPERIVRNFAYLFRLRGDYDLALLFYQKLDELLEKLDQPDEHYYTVFGLALTAQRMGNYALSAKYADRALSDFNGVASYDGPLMQIQAINMARLGEVEKARDYFDKAKAFFDSQAAPYDQFWRINELNAQAEIARAEGRFQDALDLMENYWERYLGSMRAESSHSVKALRADLAAELARERAERALLESERTLAMQQLRAQRITLIFLGSLMVFLGIAYVLQRRTSRALDVSRRKAEAANIAKSRFLANISHELRTPLNAIIGFSDLMLMAGKKKDKAKSQDSAHLEYATLINKSGVHLLDIINDILNIAQIEAGEFELNRKPCRFQDLVDDAMQIITNQARAGGKDIRFDVPADLPRLLVERRRMKQVLINLLFNAIKFTGEDGKIEIAARYLDDGRFSFAIKDNGIGIAADRLDSICEPFAQGEDGWSRSHDGTGLGLSIVKSIVELHGGRLQIESTVDVGTTVTVILPALCVEKPAPQAAVAAAA